MMKLEGGFIQNLGRVYGIYTLGFLGFVILMAFLSRPASPHAISATCSLASQSQSMR